MNILKLITGIFLLIITLTGCLRVNTTINLNSDGSGTIEETVYIKEMVLDMIRQFSTSFDEGDSANASEEFNFYNEDEQRNRADKFGEGVVFKGGERIIEKGWDGYKVVYTFKDINKLKLDLSPDNKINIGDEVEEESSSGEEFITFSFLQGELSELYINLPKPDLQNEKEEEPEVAEADSLEAGMTEMFKNMFDGMKISAHLKVNGKIEETNASYIQNNTITMLEVDFSNILTNDEVVKALEKQKPGSIEDFREITKNIDGIKIEFNDRVSVKFR